MSFNIFHRHANGTIVQANNMVSITEEGKKALSSMTIPGKAYPILLSLDQHSPMSYSNLSREARLDIKAVEVEVNRLKGQGYVSIRNYQEENR